MKPPNHNEGPKEKWNQMGRMAILGVGGANHHENLLRGKSKGNVLGARKRTSEKREHKKLSFTEGVFLLVT